MTNHGLLSATLEIAVTLRIADIKLAGGPWQADWDRVQGYVDDLIAHGDELLYSSQKKGESARYFNQAAEALAVLSFAPGGIKLFGFTFSSVADVANQPE